MSHHAWLFANRRGNRLKLLVHDGHGLWLAQRRLHQGRSHWQAGEAAITLTRQQFDALVLRPKPIADQLHAWLMQQRQKVPNNSATAKAIDYSLKRWVALTRSLSDGQIPIDNNWIENQIRPIAIGRKNWLFTGSQRTGKRAAAIMSLIQSAKLNGHDPHAYLKNVLTRRPTHRASRIGELLPHRWQAEAPLT